MNKNPFYAAPEAELLVVRFEEGILYVSGGANYSTTPGGASGDDSTTREERATRQGRFLVHYHKSSLPFLRTLPRLLLCYCIGQQH